MDRDEILRILRNYPGAQLERAAGTDDYRLVVPGSPIIPIDWRTARVIIRDAGLRRAPAPVSVFAWRIA